MVHCTERSPCAYLARSDRLWGVQRGIPPLLGDAMKLSLNYDNYRNPVTRGGGWIGYSSHARAACRFDLHPGYRDIVGFRVCRSVR